jgi:hypothetical protein
MPLGNQDFNLQDFLTRLRIWTVELAAFVVFIVWIVRSVLHELGMR